MSQSQLEPRFADDFKAWKDDPSQKNNARILKTLHPVIEAAAQHHVGNTNPLLISRARIMALHSLHSYDPTKGKLVTHLYSQLQGLRRVNQKQTAIISAPEKLLQERQMLHEHTQNLTAELGREPSDAELMNHTGLSAKRIAKIRSYHSGVSEGSMEDEETGVPFDPETRSTGQQPSMWAQAVYDDLDPYHQIVMEHALGMHGKPVLPNHKIAAKLKRSPGAISQAKRRIQDLLDAEDELSPFGN